MGVSLRGFALRAAVHTALVRARPVLVGHEWEPLVARNRCIREQTDDDRTEISR